ncbi:YidH family protein [Yoonia sp. 208BN28-4]|uniref:YidH family protein n=1 Tax=Yoonia sp. 208BN28-4 TaxID=3126505 RepID=UPI0030AF61E7
MTENTDSTEMAQDRTDWAEDRTAMANERTFAGWMRTGMACIALAVGLKAVFGEFDPTWLAKAVATLFLIGAIAIFWSARNRAKATQKRLESRTAELQPASNFTLLASLLTIGAITTGAILWVL